jgi:hypothetical protein
MTNWNTAKITGQQRPHTVASPAAARDRRMLSSLRLADSMKT